MFLLENFWKIAVCLIAAIAGYFTWVRHEEEKKQQILAKEFAEYFDPTIHTSRSAPKRFNAAFLQAIATAQRVEKSQKSKKEGNPIDHLVKAATQANGLEKKYAQDASRTVRDALRTCNEFGIFDDGGNNLDLMDIGKPPIITKGPYEGIPLVPTTILNPLILKEGLNQFLNTTLVPEPIQTLNAYSLTSKGIQASTVMKRAGIITPDRSDRVKRLLRSYKNKTVAEIKAAF